MSQHDYNIANAPGASFRADINNVLNAIASNNSGATAPATTFAHMFWADTAEGVIKMRNATNTAWITVGLLGAEVWNGEITPTQLVVDTHNYNPTGLSSAATIRVSSSTSINLTGLAGGYSNRIITLINVGSQDISINHESGSSSSENRFSLPSNSAISLSANRPVTFIYDITSQRWRMVARSYASASKSAMEAFTSGSLLVPPNQQHNHLLHPKAWCTFNGFLTGTNVPLDGAHVTSITRVGAGRYEINLAITFANLNYAVFGMCEIAAVNHFWVGQDVQSGASAKSTTMFPFTTRRSDGVALDRTSIYVAFYGRLA